MNIRLVAFLSILTLLFCVLPTSPAVADLFDQPLHWGVGVAPWSVAISDFDGNGISDLATANNVSDDITILLGLGEVMYQVPANYECGQEPTCVAVGDLNLDGHPDLAVTRDTFPRVSVLLGNGDGTFQDWVPFAVGAGPKSVAVSDFDDDGHPDLVTANSASQSVSILLGDGTGSFSTASDYPVDLQPKSVAVNDFNLDDVPDLAVANYLSNKISILLGNGDGSFGTATNYWSLYNPYSIATDDLDADGAPDLAVANFYGSNISILMGNGDGTFESAIEYEAGGYPTAVAIADLDGDQIPDLAATAIGLAEDGQIYVFLGNGDGTFQNSLVFYTGSWSRSIAVGELGGDSLPDLAVANAGDHTVSVLINTANPVRVVAGPGPGFQNPPLVRVYLPVQNGPLDHEFSAYGAPHYGTNVTCADVKGDATEEILTGAGPGDIYGPHVRGFEVDGTPLPGLNFLAYGTNKFGVNVAAGDLNGDGHDEIITGAGPGAVFGPHVRGWIYSGTSEVTPYPGVSYFAYGTPKWGVNVSAGDIDGDGFDEIVTGPGPGAVYGPHVRGWNVDSGTVSAIPAVSYFAYGTLKFGVNVSCGDVDGDGIDEIITGAGPGAVFGPHVRGWNYDNISVTPLPGLSFFAWDTEPLSFGANVFAGADLNIDGRNELVVGRGPDPTADTEVKIFTYDGVTVSQWLSLEAFPGLTHGTITAAGRF